MSTHNPLSPDRRRRLAAGVGVLVLCATATAGLAGRADAAKAPPAGFTWTGADAVANGNDNWSDAGNWAGGIAPAPGSTVSVSFPALACVAAGTCNLPDNDVSGLTLSSLRVTEPGQASSDSANGYEFGGDAVTLAGPLTSGGDSSTGSAIPNSAFYEPFTLGGSSVSWALSQTQTVFGDPLSGSAALKITFSPGSFLSLNGDSEIGKVTLVGAVKGTSSNGELAVFGSLDSTDGNKITATDVGQFLDGGSFGPYTTDDVNIQLGNGGDDHDHGSTSVSGALALGKTNSLSVIALEPGTSGAPQAGTDYPVWKATGAVKLAGELNVYVDCDAPIGFSYTFISGSKVSGSFTDANGDPITNGEVIPSTANSCTGPSPDVKITITAKPGTVTATTVATGSNAVGRSAVAARGAIPTVVRIHAAGRSALALAR